MHRVQLTSPSGRFMQVEAGDSLLVESCVVGADHVEVDARVSPSYALQRHFLGILVNVNAPFQGKEQRSFQDAYATNAKPSTHN